MKENKIAIDNIYLTPTHVFNYRKGSIIDKKGGEIFLEHRLRDFIFILIKNKNEVVTRDELMEHVWKDVMVNDESVTKAASDLRKFLANNSIDGVQLVTLRKLGYKLEITASTKNTPARINYMNLTLKVFGYVAIILFLLIVLIRAARY